MKIEISYKNSLIGSLSAGESLALHLNGSKLTEDLIVRAVGDVVEIPSLSAPTIEIADSTLNIYDEEGLATSYDILVDGEVKATVEKPSEATVTITNTSTTYAANVGTDFVGVTASNDIGTVGKNSTETFTIPKGSTIYICSATGVIPWWYQSSIEGDGSYSGGVEYIINGDCTITGYAYDAD